MSETVTGDISELYAAAAGELTLQLYAYTGDFAAAQDAVQEAFCRALPRWERISRYDDPAAWVRRVAWNVATSRWRRLRTAAAHLVVQRPATVAGPEPDHVALVAALRRLPANHRRAVVLHYLAGLTAEEIGAQDGVAPATVRVWLHRGRTAMAALLIDGADTDEGSAHHV
ncbi:sigma-70 family RNA polymerase sigma factor [Hamadaea tsunoensis]|uniref:sigma-70 family RNA polymerase sigma factor n=1 Tax=Hamadaea tsunoensis TaxID=53368 RepID=UPI000559A0B2|nr:sigma-70 family RNA polymerase sigma factor [Hamadaea tsunoensis]